MNTEAYTKVTDNEREDHGDTRKDLPSDRKSSNRLQEVLTHRRARSEAEFARSWHPGSSA